MLKIWLIGATSKVGQELRKLLDIREIELLETDLEEIDITNLEEVHRYMHMTRPEIIINCANAKESATVDDMFKVNAIAPKNISIVSNAINAKLIHLSSYEVFPVTQDIVYQEFDTPIPDTIYGKSKLAGEEFIKNFTNKYIIIRRGQTYTGFVQQVIDACHSNTPISAASNQYIQLTSPKSTAKLIFDMLPCKDYGTYHATTTGVPSQYEIAVEIVRILNSSVTIEKIDNLLESYKAVDNFMLRLTQNYTMPTWQEGLTEYLMA
ncbi:MAG: hypothetical protein BEN19_09165 [Epulopiscium sp. Nuni2H_MBin003]|nr:MAG: hypothetical protein BEN19_09165 [Epulopiscium sp. Nuni2H_MBin003]